MELDALDDDRILGAREDRHSELAAALMHAVGARERQVRSAHDNPLALTETGIQRRRRGRGNARREAGWTGVRSCRRGTGGADRRGARGGERCADQQEGASAHGMTWTIGSIYARVHHAIAMSAQGLCCVVLLARRMLG